MINIQLSFGIRPIAAQFNQIINITLPITANDMRVANIVLNSEVDSSSNLPDYAKLACVICDW